MVPKSGILSREQIRTLIEGTPPLVENVSDLDRQLQPNGIDFTVARINSLESAGFLGFAAEDRKLPLVKPVRFGDREALHLDPGAYQVEFEEVLHLPNHIMALGWSRSSLLRAGVLIGSAVWDAGFSGQSVSLLVVHNRYGFDVTRHARLLHVVFFRLTEETAEGYSGAFRQG